MYSVLIVDDEINVIRDIEALLKSSGFRFAAIYKTQSSREAKRMLLSNSGIKLIFSDINMPECDGFELLEYAKKHRGDVSVVFITGYAKFEYAHQSLKLGAADFLLKPIKKDEFEKCLENVAGRIDSDTDTADSGRHNSRFGNIARNILKGMDCPEEDMKYISELCGFSEKTSVTLALIKCVPPSGDVYEYSQYIKHMINGFFENSDIGIFTFDGYESNEVLCLHLTENENIAPTGIFSEFHESLDASDKKSLYICISDSHSRLTSSQYQHCSEIYFERLLKPDAQILTYKKYSKTGINEIIEKVNTLELLILAGDTAGVKNKLAEILDRNTLENEHITLKTAYYIIANSIVLTINKLLDEVDASVIDELLSDNILKKAHNTEDIINFFYSVILVYCTKREKGEINIRTIVEFINANYTDQLTLTDIGKRFGISSNYLSKIFKQETGENFTRYLNNLRIAKACEYLISGEIKIVRIAETVGYNDIQYFHRVFKKITGMTPVEYRMKERLKKD